MGRNMGARNSGPGLELRQGVTRQSIRITFQYFGRRCRESLPLPHTKTNIAYAKRLRGEIVNAIERNDFRYEEYFPNSRTAKEFRREQLPLEAPQAVVTIGDLLRDSLRIAQHNLALSTYNCYAQVAKNHLFPRWGDTRATVLTAKMLREWIMSISLKRKTIQLILTPLRNAVEPKVRLPHESGDPNHRQSEPSVGFPPRRGSSSES